MDHPGISSTVSGVVLTEAEPKLSWWWSRDDERFYGPCHSRADAIMDAWADDADQGAYICLAATGEWRTDIIDADVLAEAFDDANYEQADPDGDPASALMGSEEWKKLAERLNQIVRSAIRDVGLASWGFQHQHPSEWIDIAKMWAAAETADTSDGKEIPGGTKPFPTPAKEADQ